MPHLLWKVDAKHPQYDSNYVERTCGDLISEHVREHTEQFPTHMKCCVNVMLLLSLLFLLGSVLVLRTFFHHTFLNSLTPGSHMVLMYHVLPTVLWNFWNLTFTILKIKKPFGLYCCGSSLAAGIFTRGLACPWILISFNLPADSFRSVLEVNVH